MAVAVDTVTTVTLKGPDYLRRVRRIVECMAASVGMDSEEANDAALALSEACVNAMRYGSPHGFEDHVCVTLQAHGRTLKAEVTDCGGPDAFTDNVKEGMGIHLMRALADEVEFIKRSSGLTVRLSKCAKHARYRRRASARAIV
jgi:anti-sigma regulatory factor (Ser/Thr protein kinase)